MINNIIDNLEKNTFINYLSQPYKFSRIPFKKAFNPEYPLWDRVKHFVIGTSLWIPGANYIIYWALQKFNYLNSEQKNTQTPSQESIYIPAKIKFGQARAREFDKDAPPADIADRHSRSLSLNDNKKPKKPIKRRMPQLLPNS